MAPTSRTAFRLDPELLARIDKRAQAEGVSRTDFVIAACEAALASNRKLVSVSRPPASRRVARKMDPKDCSHPVGMRIKGTNLCGQCNGPVK